MANARLAGLLAKLIAITAQQPLGYSFNLPGQLLPDGTTAQSTRLRLCSDLIRVVRAAPDDEAVHQMRANVLRGDLGAWEAGPRSAAELREAAAHFERAAALCPAPALKANHAGAAVRCRLQAEDMQQ